MMEGHMRDFVVKLMYVSFWVKPSWKFTCMSFVHQCSICHV